MDNIKLHLGCGKRYLKGYVHIDLADFEHIDHKNNIDSLPMFKDESVDLIYSSHTLEYFDRLEAVEVLKEWKRVLKLGGMLRLAVPDFEVMSDIYKEKKDLDVIVGPLYGRWPVEGSDKILYHKTAYDFDSLKSVLESAGFCNIARWDWRDIFVSDLEGYDDFSQAYIPHMDKDNGKLISLNIEAEKAR